MNLLCPACLASVEAPDALMAEPGAKMRCPNCRVDFLVRPAPERQIPRPPTRFPMPGRDSASALPVAPPPLAKPAAPLPPRPPQRSSTAIPAFKPAAPGSPTPAGGIAPPFSSLLHDLQQQEEARQSSTSLRAFPSAKPAVTPPAPAAPTSAGAPSATVAAVRADAAVAFGWERTSPPSVSTPAVTTRFSEAASTDSRHQSLAPDDAPDDAAAEQESDGALPVATIAEASLPPVTVALTALAMLVCLIGAWLLWVAYRNDGLLDLRRLDRALDSIEAVARPPSMRKPLETLAPVGALGTLEVTDTRQSIYPNAAGTELVVVEGYVVNRSADTTFRRIYLRVTATSLRDEVFIDRLIPAGALLEQPGLEAIRDGASLAQTYDALERRAASLQVAPGQRTPFSAVAIVPKGGNLEGATIRATVTDGEQLVPEACWRPATAAEGSAP